MMLFNLILAELCFFLLYYGYEQSSGQAAVAILLDEGGKWLMLLFFQARAPSSARHPREAALTLTMPARCRSPSPLPSLVHPRDSAHETLPTLTLTLTIRCT
jgi:hypothetical protein